MRYAPTQQWHLFSPIVQCRLAGKIIFSHQRLQTKFVLVKTSLNCESSKVVPLSYMKFGHIPNSFKSYIISHLLAWSHSLHLIKIWGPPKLTRLLLRLHRLNELAYYTCLSKIHRLDIITSIVEVKIPNVGNQHHRFIPHQFCGYYGQ